MTKTGARRTLAKTLERNGSQISFVLFDLVDKFDVECVPDEPYELRIVLVYPASTDTELAASAAEKIAADVYDAVCSRLHEGCGINLTACMPISEDDITVGQAKLLRRWDLAYVTAKLEAAQPE